MGHSKAEIRKQIRERFSQTSVRERSIYSGEICEAILRNTKVNEAKTILAFHPLKDEVDILPLLSALVKEGKTVLLPEVTSDTDMQLREYNSEENLQSGVLGTQFPQGKVYTDYQNIDVALIPGMAFDQQGNRLGRGKGYYDRFLSLIPNAHTIGICYPYQLLDNIPHEDHDAMMNETVCS